MTHHPDISGTAVAESTADIVASLASRLPDITRTIDRVLVTEIAELRGDPALQAVLQASTAANVDTVFDALQCGIPIDRVQAPAAALEYARRLAQRDVALNALVRAYRLGQQVLIDLAFDQIAADLPPRLGLRTHQQVTQVTFHYIDRISQQVIAAYEAEREQWLRNRNRDTAVRVRELLDGGEVDIDVATVAIRYPLRRTHLALMLWYTDADASTGGELARLESFVRTVTAPLHLRDKPLFLADDRVTAWVWIPLRDADPTEVVAALRAVADSPGAPHIAAGSPLSGIRGFRRSHTQAVAARRLALTTTPTRKFTTATEPGFAAAALLNPDISAIAPWIAETLGALANDTENDAWLRDTLRVFLHHGGSYKAVADELGLHYNTVRYRVARAVERRGCPIADDRLDVETALLACHRLGAAVLVRPCDAA